MRIEIQLKEKTPASWADFALSHFDDFLLDHAACERKASATGINFICRYPDRIELIDPMLRLAREELLHFHQVARLALKRGLQLTSDEKDPYVNSLLKLVRNGRDEHLLDRLLAFGIIEARGTERFDLIAQFVEDLELKKFYRQLTDAEARHHLLFVELAQIYFPDAVIQARLDELLDAEAQILKSLPLRAAVH